MTDIINRFTEALRAAGYEPVKPITGDTGNRFLRLRFMGEKKSSGRYRLIIGDDFSIGIFGSDKDQSGFQVWRSWDGEKLSDADYRKAVEWQKKKQKELEKQQKARDERNARRITKLWGKSFSEVPPDHPYLVKKGIERAEQAKYREKTGEIIIPCVCPKDGRIFSLQKINEKGDKLFLRGGRVKGTFCPLAKAGESNDKFFVCEGYATGMTIRKATKAKTFVAFNAYNLVFVTQELKDKYPEATIVIAGDNDKYPSKSWPKGKKWVNTGEKKAQEAAVAVGGFVMLPEFDADMDELRLTDWNDYESVYGIEKVNKLLTASGKREVVEKSEPDTPSPRTQSSRSSHPFTVDESNWGKHLRWKDGVEGVFFDSKYSLQNAILYLAYDPLWRGIFVYDEFQQIERIVKPLPWDDHDNFHWRDITDSDKTQLRGALMTKGINIGSNGEMGNILQSVSRKQTIHPVRKYFKSMEWDGIERLDTWLIDYCEATEQPEEYIKSVSACFIKAAVKRVFNPGEPFHHMLVLEGRQAAGKSSLLEALATFNGMSYFSDGISFDDIGNNHVAQFMRGKLIIEFAELSGLSAKDRNKVKSWITMASDEFQPKFSNEVVKLPRQFVLAGTTNDEGWLNDPTGGRRFWPVKVGKIDVAGVKRINEQLWAEAIHRVNAGEMHYIADDSPIYYQAMQEQSARMQGHVWEDQIKLYLRGRSEVTVDEILVECLLVPRANWRNIHKTDIGDILRALGYSNKPVYDRRHGKAIRKWVK